MITAEGREAIDVLLVEDNKGDVILVRQALNAIGAKLRLHVVTDGPAALAFVDRQDPRPSLIILDLNLPEKSGLEVLDELKLHDIHRTIPVVIFSSSKTQEDVVGAYRSQASGYVHKPADVDDFFAAIAGIQQYWSTTVTHPLF